MRRRTRAAEPAVEKFTPHGLIHIDTYDPFLSVADKQRGGRASSSWSLCVANGSLCFFTDGATRRPAQDAPEFPSPGGELRVTYLFAKDGAKLRLFIPEGELKSKVFASNLGWYVTGDYSTNPPSVTLTKEPTTHSEWEFPDSDYDERNTICFIKNKNDQNTNEWLYFEDDGTVYKHGQELRKPILSKDKKCRYLLERFPDGR